MKWGLAMSGGAMRGMAHIGVLKALCENNLKPDYVSGTSAGSIVAGMYACGMSPEEMERNIRKISRSIFDYDYSGMVKGIGSFVINNEPKFSGMIKGRKLEKLLYELTNGKLLNQVNKKVAITAVNIKNGHTIYFVNRLPKKINKQNEYFTEYTVAKAIHASIAIPVIFKPVEVSGRLLVDGGVTVPLPSKILKDMGANKVLGVSFSYNEEYRDYVDNIFEIGNQSLDIMGKEISRIAERECCLVLRPQVPDVKLVEIEKAGICIRKGYEYTINHINEIKKALFYNNSTSSFYMN